MIKIEIQDKKYIFPGRFIADPQNFKYFVNDLVDTYIKYLEDIHDSKYNRDKRIYELKEEIEELIFNIHELERENEKLIKELNLYKQQTR